MNTKIELTVEEGLEVVDALREVALNHGWDEDELEDSDVIEEYAAAVDAALRAMGMEFLVVIDDDDEEEEEEDEDEYSDEDEDDEYWDEDEDEDEDEEEGEHIPEHEANRLMDFACAIFCICNAGRDRVDDTFKENAVKFAQTMFTKFCMAEGITHVDEDE